MSFLSPTKIINTYPHITKVRKILLPLTIASYFSNKYNLKTYNNVLIYRIFYICHIILYVSTSCIISDYIKIPKLDTLSRFINLKSHSLATIGFIYYIVKNNKKDV